MTDSERIIGGMIHVAKDMRLRLLKDRWLGFGLVFLLLGMLLLAAEGKIVYPGEEWAEIAPESVGMASGVLDALAADLGGRGCVIRNGYLVKSWGTTQRRGDWFSSAKPVFSTLLFFAIEEGRVQSVHEKISKYCWDFQPKDQGIEFFHLANMISGYARPERPGDAWAYNDYGIQLYQMTLFDRVFNAPAAYVFLETNRLGPLQFQDNPAFRERNRRFVASARDFARIAWFWCRKGKWGDHQLLPKHYFDRFMKPQTPKDLPSTQPAATDDYFHIGTFGGESDHFTEYGAGIYGFNWWFNLTGRLHPNSMTWPDAPADTVMSIGVRGNHSVIIPSLNLVLVNAYGNWGKFVPGDPESAFNQSLKRLMSAVR
ncbi:MAG: hypothetical protein M2R45_03076 [Verrucomicrobia subdivision 3 bacterium]|nr:hypothetical protein [Limisphaerales bacterium]MCS1416562.1 hypothetical protein [Limisphaerales bacterium]